jgi:hypothetical protein
MTSRKFFICNILRSAELWNDTVIVNKRLVDLVWIQGVVVDYNPDTKEMIVDDGTDTILVSTDEVLQNNVIREGSYVMIQGFVIIGEDDFGKIVVIKARLLYDLSPSLMSDVNMETLWQYEVMEALSDFAQIPPVIY